MVAYGLQPCDYESPSWFIRLYCGLEDVDDLIEDVAQALPALQ